MPTSYSDFPFDVFVSYSHADREWVRDWLILRLKAEGFRVCVDYESFDIGVPAVRNMERAVEQSRKALFILTPNWTESDWADFESLLLQTGDPVGRLRRMLPLMLKKCAPRPGVSILTYADFTDPKHWESEFVRLVDALRDKLNFQPGFEVPRLTASARVPFVLPQLDVPTFSGRVEELALLEELLLKREGAKVCSIVGLAGAGGIGKSALACHFAELHRDEFPGGVIGLRVDGKDADALAREFARHIGEELDPEDERDAATIMQEVFRHRRALLIFDNADDASIAPLRPGGDTCAVIVTTRDRQLPFLLGIPEEGRINLSPLPYADALLLLERLLGKERVAAEQGTTDEIIGLVGMLPLALQIVGATLQMQEGRSLENYAASLREERERLSKLQVRGAKHLDVRASFSLSLKLLKDEEVGFFACLSVCAQDGFSVRGAMAVGDCDEATAHERVGYLYRLSLLNRHQSDTARFVFHPLIRLFAQELASEHSLHDGAAERHARYFVQLVKSGDGDDKATDDLLATELDDIILAAEWLQRREEPDYEFVISLEPFLQGNGYWQQAVRLMTGFLRLAEQIEDWNAVVQLRIQQAKFLSLRGEWERAQGVLTPIGGILERVEPQSLRLRFEAMCLSTLGGIQQRLGRFDEAADTLRRSADIEEQLGNRRGQAKVLTSLGGVLQRLGNFDEAASVLHLAAAVEELHGNLHGQAMVLNSLGGVLQRQGHFNEALTAFRRSYDLLVHLGDLRGQAMILNSLGGVLQRQGQFEEAVDVLRRSVAVEEKIDNQRGLAMALNSLGGVLQRVGRFDESVEAFRHSYGLLVEQGDRRGQAMVLNSLGGVLQRTGRFDEALDVLQRGRAISEQLNDEITLSQMLNSLGGVLQRTGRFEEALEAFSRSYAISEQLDDQRSLAMALNSLGGVLQRVGRFDEAADAFRRSYDLLVGQGDRRGQAMVLNSLGGVLDRTGKFEEALEDFRRSIEIGEELGDRRHLSMAHTALGKTLLAHGEVERAIEELREGFTIDEGLKSRRGMCIVTPALVRALVKSGRREEALEYYRRALAVAPEEGRLLSLREQFSDARVGTGEVAAVVQGVVKVVIRHKQGYRYGFIAPDDGSADVYFREGYIDAECLNNLAQGVRVEAETEPGGKSPRARSIRIIDPD